MHQASLTLQAIQTYEEMGFTRLQIEQAHQLSLTRKQDILDILVQLGTTNKKEQQVLPPQEVQHMDPKLRRASQPTVLKTNQSVKFFNSFLQVFFHIPKFVEYVFAHDFQIQNINQYPRLGVSLNLMKELQELFCLMIFSKKKDVDPKKIFINIVDDMGNQQSSSQSFEEFILYFFSRIDEALNFKSLANQIKQSRKASDQDLQDKPQDQQQSTVLIEKPYKIMLSSGKKKNSSIHLTQEQMRFSPIQELFIGQIVVVQNGENGSQDDNFFHMITLTRDFPDIYEAWQNKYQIEGNCQSEIWIKRVPKILIFQILQTEGQASFKINPQIYIDRFLFMNKINFLRNRRKLQNLKAKKTELEELLKNYESFNQTNVSVPSILQLTIKLLQDHGKISDEENPAVETMLEAIIGSNTQINKLQEEIELTKVKFLFQQKHQIDDLFANMKNFKYDLHSMIVGSSDNDTSNESVYIRHRVEKDKWMKFEEATVEKRSYEASIGEVMESQNTLFLIYVESQFDVSENDHYAPNYDIIESQPRSQDYDLLGIGDQQQEAIPYQQLVGEGLKRIANDHNKQFDQELQNMIFLKQAEDAISIYNERLSMVNKILNQWKNTQQRQPPLHNVAVFLKSQSHDNLNDDIYKWQIFDCSIRDATNGRYTLSEIKSIPPFAQKSSHLFLNMSSLKAPTTINVSNTDLQRLNVKLFEYVTHLQQAKILVYAIQCFLEEKWINGLSACRHVMELHMNNYYDDLAFDLFKVVLLRLACQTFNMHANGQTQILLEYCEILRHNLPIMPFEELICNQAIKMLNDLVKKCSKKIINSDNQKVLKSFTKAFQERNQKELSVAPIKSDPVLDQIINDSTINQNVHYWSRDNINDVNIEVANQISLIHNFFQIDFKFKNDLSKLRISIDYEDRLRRGYHKPI